eukprot:352338-Chlamydomonas_euryale.AAC.15
MRERFPLEPHREHLHVGLRALHDRRVLLRTAQQVGHHLRDTAVWHVLERGVAVLAECERQVVRHAQQLAKVHGSLARLQPQTCHVRDALLDRRLVVARDHDLRAAVGHLLHDRLHARVIACMRRLDVGPHRRLVAHLLRAQPLQ